MIPGPVASPPLGNSLEMQILGPHPDLLNLKLGVKWQQSVLSQAFREFLMHTNVENHFPKILGDYSKLPHFTHNSRFLLLTGDNCQSSTLMLYPAY